MGKPFNTRAPGQKQEIFADEYNSFLDNSRRLGTRNFGIEQNPGTTNTEKQIVYLQNDSSVDIPQYGVVMIKDLIFQPSDNVDEFKFRFGFKGLDYKQAGPDSQDPLLFMVAQGPIGKGEVGKGMINGTTQAQVVVNDEFQRYVRPLDNSFNLETAESGPGRIQFVEAGGGLKWAVIQIATSDNQRFKFTNVGAQAIPEGGAMEITGMAGTGSFSVTRPSSDNVIHVLPNTGPPLLPGNSIFMEMLPMMKFRVNAANVAKMVPGSNIGVVSGAYELDISHFGFLVYGVDTTSPNGPYAYCGLNGIVSLLTAVSDEDAGKIDVQRSDVTGTGDGDTFSLDVVVEP